MYEVTYLCFTRPLTKMLLLLSVRATVFYGTTCRNRSGHLGGNRIIFLPLKWLIAGHHLGLARVDIEL